VLTALEEVVVQMPEVAEVLREETARHLLEVVEGVPVLKAFSKQAVALEASCQLVVEASALTRPIPTVQMPARTVGDCSLDLILKELEEGEEVQIREPWALEVASVLQLLAA